MGASNYSAARLKEALQISKRQGLPRYECLEPLYNLYCRQEYEQELELVCREENIGVTNYSALANGFLTGKYRTEGDFSKSLRGASIKQYLNARGLRILDALDAVAEEYRTTPASIAVAWLIARPGITAPIASATSLTQLDSLIQAAQIELSSEAVETLNQASAY